MKKHSFRDAEAKCEATFSYNCDNWWHLYTPGKETPVIFQDDSDFRYSMNLMARCSTEFQELVIVAFEIMNNHIHIVLAGEEEKIKEFFMAFRRRLVRYLSQNHYMKPFDCFQLRLKAINDLKMLRNTIVYVNRNGYVANPDHTPYSYPWGTGAYYFNTQQYGFQNVKDLKDTDLRKLFHGRVPCNIERMQVTDGMIAPSSYCSIQLGMSMFRDAHQYFSMLTKNVEAYSELACELDDGEFLTDSELFAQLAKLLRTSYGVANVQELTKSQLVDAANKLHYDYHASNGQIRRLLGITQYEADSLFPLSV